MSKNDQDLRGLISEAQKSVQPSSQENNSLSSLSPSKPGLAKSIVAGVLLVLAIAFLFTNMSRFSEPYQLDDFHDESEIVAADLNLIASEIEAYRLTRGGYPESLGEVEFSVDLNEIMQGTELTYQLQGDSFNLNWLLPSWRASFDGDLGQIQVEVR